MIATIRDLTDISVDDLEDIDIHRNCQVRYLTIQNLFDLYYILKLPQTGDEPAAVIVMNYLTARAIKLNKHIY